MDRLLAGDRGEVVEELVEGVTAFEVVNKILERNARASEDHGAAEDFRIGMEYGAFVHGRDSLVRTYYTF